MQVKKRSKYDVVTSATEEVEIPTEEPQTAILSNEEVARIYGE